MSGIQSNAGSGAFQPVAGGSTSNCNVYSLFQGKCVSNGGLYYCNPLVDQLMNCAGTYAPYDLQTTVITAAADAGTNQSRDSGSKSAGNLIVIR